MGEPMQIDTHNRNYSINDQEGYQPSFMPNMVLNNMTNLKSGLSPLIECPCSDRITKTTVTSSSILTADACKASIDTIKECTAAILATEVTSSITVEDPKLPAGCIMKPDNA